MPDLLLPHLFSPLRIGTGLTLRNRLVSAPHTTVFAEPGGYPGPREAAYRAARARGGAGLIVLGTSIVHPSSPLDYGVLANLDDSYIPGYRLVAEAVHQHGAALFAQLNHQGAAAHGRGTGRPLVAPAPVPSFVHGEVPRALEVEEIQEIVRAFAAAAARCQRAGVDGVLIHAAHGYLLNQFLSPLTNRRTDQYGGSLANRLRLLWEVLTAVRAATGPAYPVGVRLSVDELVPGGLTLDESLEIIRRLDRGGLVDYLDVSCGIDTDLLSHGRHYPGMQLPEETWVDLAAAVKRVASVPVACAGRIGDPQRAERLLAEGTLDLVQMARALIADPDLPNKAREGRWDEIRPCLYISSGCLGRLYRGQPIGCVQNPTVGQERELDEIPPAARARRVVVVGGGPAGMQAAVVARQRGHHVVLFERAPHLGGQMWTAAQAPGRADLLAGVRFLERELERRGVDVRLGVDATRQWVLDERPDAVLVATGSDAAPFEPAVPDPGRVCSVREVLDGVARVGQRVVVVDGLGRLAAASTADYLAARGHDVAIVTRDYAVGAHIDQTTRPIVEYRLRAAGVRQIAGTEVIGFDGSSVQLRDCFTGRVWSLDGVDTLVHDLGGRPRDALYAELAGFEGEVRRIGDCLAPRELEDAYRDGFQAALAL